MCRPRWRATVGQALLIFHGAYPPPDSHIHFRALLLIKHLNFLFRPKTFYIGLQAWVALRSPVSKSFQAWGSQAPKARAATPCPVVGPRENYLSLQCRLVPLAGVLRVFLISGGERREGCPKVKIPAPPPGLGPSGAPGLNTILVSSPPRCPRAMGHH